MNYNYITSAALDCGLFVGMIVIFLALKFPGVEIPNWFGNDAVRQTLDARNLAVRADLRGPQQIGPSEWP